jgi:hypothetical protein
MKLLSQAMIRDALEVLAHELEATGSTRQEKIVLADGAKGYLKGILPGEVLLDRPALLVRALGPQQLLAMKLSAWRDDVDINDARLLLPEVRGTREEVWSAVEPFLVPGRELKARFAFEDLWESVHGT